MAKLPPHTSRLKVIDTYVTGVVSDVFEVSDFYDDTREMILQTSRDRKCTIT